MNLDEAIFLGLLPFSGVTLLKWFTKSSKFEGLNDNELLRLFSKSLLAQQTRKFLLLDDELKGKITMQHFMQYQDLAQFSRYL